MMNRRDLAPCFFVSSAALLVRVLVLEMYHAKSDSVCSGPWLAFHEEAWDGKAHCCDDQDDVDDVERCLDAGIEETHCWTAMRLSSLLRCRCC